MKQQNALMPIVIVLHKHFLLWSHIQQDKIICVYLPNHQNPLGKVKEQITALKANTSYLGSQMTNAGVFVGSTSPKKCHTALNISSSNLLL